MPGLDKEAQRRKLRRLLTSNSDLTIHEAARRVGVSPPTAYRWARAMNLRNLAINSTTWRRMRKDALAELLEADPELPMSEACHQLEIPPHMGHHWFPGVGRARRHYIADMDPEDQERLRMGYEAGVYMVDLAREFGVLDTGILRYAQRHGWDGSRRLGRFGNPRRPLELP